MYIYIYVYIILRYIYIYIYWMIHFCGVSVLRLVVQNPTPKDYMQKMGVRELKVVRVDRVGNFSSFLNLCGFKKHVPQ